MTAAFPESQTVDQAERPNSAWVDIWKRFRANKPSMVGLVLFSIVFFAAIFAGIIAPYSPFDTSAFLNGHALSPPSGQYLFGTDIYGADIFSKVIYGARTALLVGLISTSIATGLGLAIGGLSGYFGGFLDSVLMKVTEGIMIIPMFLVILLLLQIFILSPEFSSIATVPGFRLSIIIILIGIFRSPNVARVARAEFLKLQQQEFIKSAVSLGASSRRIMLHHLLPNSFPPIAVITTLGAAEAILLETSISYLGFGDPTFISWGQMLTVSIDRVASAPWTVFFPSVAIFITVLSLYLVGMGINEALNPRVFEGEFRSEHITSTKL